MTIHSQVYFNKTVLLIPLWQFIMIANRRLCVTFFDDSEVRVTEKLMRTRCSPDQIPEVNLDNGRVSVFEALIS